jgi:hypothetical protein
MVVAVQAIDLEWFVSDDFGWWIAYIIISIP